MKSKSLFDISRLIANNSTIYPGDAPIKMEPLCSIGLGCPCNVTRLTNWSTHFLTHIDAPVHFIENGASLDQLPLQRFICDAVVVNITQDAITASDFPSYVDMRGKAVLFQTRNSLISTASPFDVNHVYVTKEAAERAVELGVNMVGIDYLSIDRFGDETYPAHYTLLGNNVLILEGLNLEAVDSGVYSLMALPLKIEGADGSPVRAVLAKSF